MSARSNLAAAPDAAPAPPVPQVIVASATLAAAFGLLEAVIQVIRMLLKSPDPMGFPILWVAPLFYGLVGLVYGGFLSMIIWLAGRFRWLPDWLTKQIPNAGLGLLAVLGYYNALTLVFATSPWAMWILALGLAYQTIRLLDRGQRGALPRLAASGPWLGGVVALLAVTVTLGKLVRERTFLAEIPPARADAPNVLLITLDTLRADHVSAYGYGRPTPVLDQLAAEGMQFDYAIATASWTLPSHATIMTGLLTHEHQADMTGAGRLDERFHTLAEAFAGNGYATAAFVANEYASAANQGFGQGFSHFDDLFWSPADMIRWTKLGERLRLRLELSDALGWPQLGRKTAEEVNREFLTWLSHRPERPFFTWLNYFDPHDPYYAPAPYANLYGTKPASGDPGSFGVFGASDWGGVLSPAETQWQMDAYDSSIAYLDAQLGLLIDALRAAAVYDNTVLVVTSDHGEAFGAGTALHEVVSSAPAPAELMHNPYHPPNHPVAQGDLTSVTSDQWHAIFLQPADGRERQLEIYARDDVTDQQDLADLPAGQNAARELESRWRKLLAGSRPASAK